MRVYGRAPHPDDPQGRRREPERLVSDPAQEGRMATAAATPTEKATALKKVGWSVMLALALLLVLFAARYFSLDPAVYFPQQRAVYIAHTAVLLLHIGGAMLAA